MSSGGGGTQTVTNNAPPPEFMAAYNNVVGQAQNVAKQPFQTYQGNTVAPFSPDQLAGMQGVENAYGMAAPYINSAADFIGSSAQPLDVQQFSPDQIAKYQSPYTDQVIDATAALFADQNSQASNAMRGNAISAGAFGGDREGVAQAVLRGQQSLAQAPVLAGLRDKSYSQALDEFNKQQQVQLSADEAERMLRGQAGAGMANLGQLAQNTSLAGANQLLNVGALQQQQAQQLLNVPYQQWQAALAYPFQTTGWLSGITTGLGGAAGGSSTMTQPSPSMASQIAGAGMAGAGLLGKTGAFGSDGWLSGLWNSPAADMSSGAWGSAMDALGALPAARGGMIPRRAPGGSVPGMMSLPSTEAPDLSLSIVPGVQPGGKPMILNNFGTTSNASGGGGGFGEALGTVAKIAGTVAMFLNNGGMVPRRAPGGMVPMNDNWSGGWPEPQLAVGGSPLVQMVPGSYEGAPMVPHLVGAQGAPTGMSAPLGNSSLDAYLASAMSGGSYAKPEVYVPPAPVAAASEEKEKPVDPFAGWSGWWDTGMGGSSESDGDGGGMRGGGRLGLADGGEADDLPEPDDDVDDAAPMIAATESEPVAMVDPAAIPAPMRPVQTAAASTDPWDALLYTGFGIMGGKSPNAAANIGQGAMEGMKLYEAQSTRRQTSEALRDWRKQQAESAKARVQEQGRHNRETEAQRARRLLDQHDIEERRVKIAEGHLGVSAGTLGESQRHHRMIEDQGKFSWQPGQGPGENGEQVAGSWRYSTNKDEKPQFFPGVVQQRTVNAGTKAAQVNRAGDQRDRAADQRDAAAAQRAEAFKATQEYRQQVLALRQQGMNDAEIANVMNNATRQASFDPRIKLDAAVAAQLAQRGKVAPAAAAPGAAPAAPAAKAASPDKMPDGTIVVQNGVRYRKQGAQWLPVQ